MKRFDFFICRPRLSTAIAVVLLLTGILAVPSIPVSLFPSVARPSISVSCTYPGANANEVMNTVAGPMEEQMNGVEGMDRMYGSCIDSGSYSLTVNFQVGYDRDLALMKVQSKVQQAMALLPQEVKNTGVTIESGSTEELGTLTIRSPKGTLTREELVDYAFGVINPAILRVPGVGKSTIKDDKIAMRIWLDSKRLAAFGLDTTDIVAAIKAQNVQASLGSVGASPNGDANSRVIALIAKGRLDTKEAFGEIIVRTAPDGGIVRLKDVARIDKGKQAYSYSALYNDQPAVSISIYQLPGVNVLGTMNAIKRQLEDLKGVLPEDLVCDMTYDVTEYMGAALFAAARSLVLALFVALAVVFAFSRSWRAMVCVALSVPVPLSVTFAALSAMGFFLNLLTLYAFVLALVLMIGFAALMVFRIRSFWTEGEDLPSASASAVRSCAVVMSAAALAIAGAMVPIVMIDGVQGVVFRQFAVVLAPAALAAAFNALVLVPVLAVRLLKGDKVSAPMVRRVLPRSGLVLSVVLVALAISALGLKDHLPREFIPDEDTGVIYVNCQLAQDATTVATDAVMRKIQRLVQQVEGVEKTTTLFNDTLIGGSSESKAKMTVILKDWKERRQTAWEISQKIEEALKDIPDAQIHVLRPPPVSGFGNQGGIAVLVQALTDSDPVNFAYESQKLCRALMASPLAEGANCGTTADFPHLRVTVDRAKCELMKVPMSTLFTTLQHYLGSVYVNDVNLGTQVNRVTVMSDWDGRDTAKGVGDLYVRSTTGDMVPVSVLATFKEELGVNACYRCDQYLYCTMQFITKPGVASSAALEEIKRISAETLPRGYLQGWHGLIYEQFKARGDMGILIALAFLAVFLVLLAVHESWKLAWQGMIPAASALFGAVLMHFITQVPMALTSDFALILLVILTTAGTLVTRASVSWIDRAFLPLVFALAMLPLVFATGAGANGCRALAVTLFGGFFAYALSMRVVQAR